MKPLIILILITSLSTCKKVGNYDSIIGNHYCMITYKRSDFYVTPPRYEYDTVYGLVSVSHILDSTFNVQFLPNIQFDTINGKTTQLDKINSSAYPTSIALKKKSIITNVNSKGELLESSANKFFNIAILGNLTESVFKINILLEYGNYATEKNYISELFTIKSFNKLK